MLGKQLSDFCYRAILNYHSLIVAELNKDTERLWRRNLGRDDRCVADLGREGWFPYLDEEVRTVKGRV